MFLIFLKKSFFVPILTIAFFFLTKNFYLSFIVNILLNVLIAKIYFGKHFKLAFLQNRKFLLQNAAIILAFNFSLLFFVS
jgi:hypothetical protein